MKIRILSAIITTFVAGIAALLLTSGRGADLLQFDHTSYNFGIVSETTKEIVHEFTFVNTASEPVAVLSVSTGCGCTRPKYPVEPIGPGKSGKVTITFLPKGQSGEINKDIKVRYRGATARSSKRITLRLRGVVTHD